MKANELSLLRRLAFLRSLDARARLILTHFLVAFLAAALLLLFFGPGAVAAKRGFEGISPGKIAERDVTAGKDVIYVDEEATRLRLEAEEKLVLPVFQLDSGVTARLVSRYKDFAATFRDLMTQDIPLETTVLMLQSEVPGLLPRETLVALATSSLKSQALVYAEDVLVTLLANGIFSLPSEGLDAFNQDYFELRRVVNEKTELEQRQQSTMVTKSGLPTAVAEQVTQKHLARPLASIVSGLVLGFASENAFFDETMSQSRLRRLRSKMEPVTRAVGRNELLVRKGELVTEENYQRILSIRAAVSRADIGLSLRGFGILCAVALIGYFMLRKGESLNGSRSDPIMILGIYGGLAFYSIALAAGRIGTGQFAFEGTYLLPVALFSGIAAALAGQGFGFSFSVLMGMLTASATNLNPYYIVFTILAGIFASYMISTAKTRLVLVRAALLQAAAQLVMSLLLLAQLDLRFGQLLEQAGLLALNGFISGALVLAILPLLEQSFNLPTRFRLLELADVNAAPLKELLTQAPGTYSHSMNVAHLAEAAAEDVGANALLARVAAYYHDIGKIEQPEYFVENQRGSNKHDDINPRLSATVIRSHVKLGIERSRELKLPREVVDIVAQHHGNSVIAWFYDKAKQADESIRKEDFQYPGSPPASREAGIVMLADSVEAAGRTLKKPSIPRLDAFVHQTIMDKVQQGQLDDCMLTLRDLETIRHSFVRIMAGQFHSRIEYPKQRENRE